MRRHGQEGFTLAEVLVALVVSALIALAVVRVWSTASANLAMSADNAVAAQQAVRLANTLTYDVSGATAVTAYDATEPTAAQSSSMCWSKSSGTAIGYTLATDPDGLQSWGWTPGPKSTTVTSGKTTTTVTTASGDASVLRAVALVKVKAPTPAAGDTDATWWAPKDVYVGYEIRRPYGGNAQNYELWRTECRDALGTLSSPPERVAALGKAATSLATGAAILRCPGSVAVTASTAPTVLGTSYTFTASASGDVKVGDLVRVYNGSNYSVFLDGTVASVTASGANVLITVTATTAPKSATGGPWVFTKDCAAGSDLLARNQFLVVQLPYSAGRNSLDTIAPLVLRTRVGK